MLVQSVTDYPFCPQTKNPRDKKLSTQFLENAKKPLTLHFGTLCKHCTIGPLEHFTPHGLNQTMVAPKLLKPWEFLNTCRRWSVGEKFSSRSSRRSVECSLVALKDFTRVWLSFFIQQSPVQYCNLSHPTKSLSTLSPWPLHLILNDNVIGLILSLS